MEWEYEVSSVECAMRSVEREERNAMRWSVECGEGSAKYTALGTVVQQFPLNCHCNFTKYGACPAKGKA